MKTLKIKLVRSRIGVHKKHQLTLDTLRLKKMHKVVEYKDSPTLRGKLNQVSYLVEVQEV